MGELKNGQLKNYDEEIMPYISSCNIACGFHSGSPELIEKTIRLAIQHQVKIGAHPSYNDRENFGRKSLTVPWEIFKTELRYQIAAVKGMTESIGQTLHHVKPHGALYNDMVANESLAEAVIQLIKEIDPRLKIFGLAHSNVIDICKKNGIQPVNEGFADRRYQKVNQLRSRSLEGAVLHDPKDVLKQIELFTKGKVRIWEGEERAIQVDSLILKSENSSYLKALGKAIINSIKRLDFVEEVIVTEVEMLIKLRSKFDVSQADQLKNLRLENLSQQNIYKLPIYFSDHEDWSGVEAATGFSKKEVIEKLLSLEFSVAMLGFLPGFVYLDGLPKELHVPRKTVPSKYVTANSLAIGGKYLGVYSIDSPGGWHVIGKLPIPILEIPNLPPVIFNPDDKIKLIAITEEDFAIFSQKNISLKEYNAKF